MSLRQLASARVKAALLRYLSLKTKEVNLIQQNAKLNAQLFREHCRVALQEIDENFPVCLRSVFPDSSKKLKHSDKRINVNNVKYVFNGCSTLLKMLPFTTGLYLFLKYFPVGLIERKVKSMDLLIKEAGRRFIFQLTLPVFSEGPSITMPLHLMIEVCTGTEMYRINRWFIDKILNFSILKVSYLL